MTDSPKSPIAATLAMREPLASLVQDACTRAGVQALAFDGVAPPAAPPSLVIAEQHVGDRRVPQRLLDAVAVAGGRARLLLLCAERLMRPHLWGEKGRLVMVSPPHTADRLANRIRVLLGTSLNGQAGSLSRSDHLTDRCWLCSFQSTVEGAKARVQPADPVGMVAVLPPPGGEADPQMLQELTALLARERSDEARLNGLMQLAGPCAVAHLAAAGDRWLFFWPSPSWPLRIHCAQRFPAHADMSGRAARRRAWSMVAAPGDLLVACAAPVAELDEAALRASLQMGGPAAIDLLGAVTERSSTPLAGLAVEVY